MLSGRPAEASVMLYTSQRLNAITAWQLLLPLENASTPRYVRLLLLLRLLADE